jgi:putative Mg2+ transporter-C (MgtC) family protein
MLCAFDFLPQLAAVDGGWLTQVEREIEAYFASYGPTGEAVIRLMLAALLGGLVGLEREIQGHEAGFRTFMLVCAGSALAMIVSLSFSSDEWVREAGPGALPGVGERYLISVDPARIAYGVMTGVGFLGAGTIIQRRDRVQGLTTAAGIWSIAALGLAAGFGMYVMSVIAALLLLLTLLVLGWVRSKLPSVHTVGVKVRAEDRPDCVERFEEVLREHGMRVSFVRFARLARSRKSSEEGVPGGVVLDARVKYFREEHLVSLRRRLMSAEDFRLLKLM